MLLLFPLAPFVLQVVAQASALPATPVFGRSTVPQGVVEAPAAPATPDQLAVRPPQIALSLGPAEARLADLDDAPPLPVGARSSASNGGDTWLEAAGGDPYFLGFAAGKHYPPAGERVDPELLASIQANPSDGRPELVAYAFAMFERRITAARTAELEALGARVLGYHPSNCLKLAIPLAAFEAVAAYPELHWLGAPQRWQRLHPAIARHAATARDGAVDLVIDVYESDLNGDSIVESIATAVQRDAGAIALAPAGAPRMTRTRSNGWQQRALESAGCEVREYVETIRAFHVRAPVTRIAALAALDFVQFVEPDFEKGPFHDDSTPMIYSDSVRYYANGATSASVVAGIIDSGVDIAHSDLNHTWGVGWEYGGTGGAWNDPCEHGTHVAGTLLGNGATTAKNRGNAPGLGWGGAGRFYTVKTSNQCSNWTGALSSWIAPFQSPYFDGFNTSPTPHVINNSWGSGVFNAMGTYVGPYYGTEADARTLDGEVYSRGQMYVFAAGNDGSGAYTVGLQPAAKNVFTVGAVDDYWTWNSDLPGELSSFSSRGPTGDARWKPNLVAPGDSILSVDANTPNGYVTKSGTSMAAPHVTGVAAQMLDHLSFLKYAPERTHSVLMATAMTKGNQTLTYPSDPHLWQYGAGKVEAWKANYGSSQMGWSNWGSYLGANTYTYADFTVSSGCTRLVVCMNYADPACSAGASSALVNDLDLWLDSPPIDPSFNNGDFFAQQSTVDNTEIRIIDSPVPGTWRWKIWPVSAPQGSYYGLTVYAQYGDITPNLSATVTPAKTYLQPSETIDVSVVVTSPSYVASNVVIDADASAGSGYVTNYLKYLNDGPQVVTTTFGPRPSVMLGDILHGNSRWATLRTSWYLEGVWPIVAHVRGDNVTTVSLSATVTVDATPPSAVDPLTCYDHAPDVWSNDAIFDFAWTPATDNLSGLAGYSISTSLDAPATPDLSVDTTSFLHMPNLGSGSQARFFNVRAVDRSGNGGAVSSSGPYYVDTDWPAPTTGLVASVPVDGTTCGEITLWWDAGSDATSGLAGYSIMIDNDPFTTPSGSLDASTTTFTTTVLPSAQPYYAHVSGLDIAGNVGLEANYGPFWVGASPTTIYCDQKLHSGGCYASISTTGCPSTSMGDDFHVLGSNVLGQTTGQLLWSLSTATPPPIGGGLGEYGKSPMHNKICVGQPNRVGGLDSGGNAGDCSGALDFHFSQAFMAANGLSAGMSVYVQFLFDDPTHVDGSELAHTDAATFTLLP